MSVRSVQGQEDKLHRHSTVVVSRCTFWDSEHEIKKPELWNPKMRLLISHASSNVEETN